MNRFSRPLLFLFSFFISSTAVAQIDDVGLWLGATANKKLTRSLEVSLSGQVRLNHDITTVDALFSDAGIEYAITKKLKASLHYRFISAYRGNYYSKRHRLYADLSYRHKMGPVAITLRERIQQQYTDINSSENGKVPEWTLRSKLAAKFDVGKKYFPNLSFEAFYIVDNANEADHLFTKLRYEAGVEYEFNRTHSVNPFVLVQQDVSSGFDELIYGFTYTYSF